MPEDLLDNLGVFALLKHERGEGVPEIVEAHFFGQAGLLQERLEVPLDKALPTHGGALRGGEDEVLIVPDTGVAQPFFRLTLAVGLEGLDGHG